MFFKGSFSVIAPGALAFLKLNIEERRFSLFILGRNAKFKMDRSEFEATKRLVLSLHENCGKKILMSLATEVSSPSKCFLSK